MWKLCLDILCLNYEGNIVDAAFIAALAALDDVVIPEVSPSQEGDEEVTIPSQQCMCGT